MKAYSVMYRNSVRLETDDLKEARAKMQDIGDTASVRYNEIGRAVYEAGHDPVLGETE